MAEKPNYEDSLNQFEELVSATTIISQGAAGRPSKSSQHYWASQLFTRLSTCGVSLLISLPRNSLTITRFEHWDFSSVASQTRNLIECYLAFYYLCIEKISKNEWGCRWNLFNLHDCSRRQKMFECFGNNNNDKTDFTAHIEDIKSRLQKNKYFLALPQKKQNDLLKAKTAYLVNQDELIKSMGMDSQFYRGMYIFLSSHIHSLPLGFYRMGKDDRGRGIENRVERNYISFTLNFACVFIQKGAQEMIDMFPDSDKKLSSKGHEVIYKTKIMI